MGNQNTIKKVEDLKPGDKFYNISDSLQVKRFTYLCIHPTGLGKYHIIIDINEEPQRIYHTYLQKILDKNLTTREEANLHLIEKLKKQIELLEYHNKKEDENSTKDKHKNICSKQL